MVVSPLGTYLLDFLASWFAVFGRHLGPSFHLLSLYQAFLDFTIVLDVSGFPDDCPINSIASKICDEFSDGDILSVQFMPSRTVSVTL